MKNREYMVIAIADIKNCDYTDHVYDVSIYKSIDELVKETINEFEKFKKDVNSAVLNFDKSMVVLSGRRFSSNRNFLSLNVFLSSVLIQDKETMAKLIEIGFKRTKRIIKI